MIRGITPGDSYEAPLKAPGPLRGAPEEKVAPEPADSAEITVPERKSATAQDMRKASIEYYPLHKKRREAHHSDSKAVAETPVTPRKSEPSAPKTITLFGADTSIADIASSLGSGIDIKQFDKKLEHELGSLAKAQNTWDMQGLDGEIPSLSKLQESFDKIKTDKSVPWEYIIDGCYARAHVTCEKLLDEGLNCGKMYVMIGDVNPNDPSSPFPDYRLKAENKFMKGEWWYHVAPLVFAKDDKTGQVEGYILDLAVNNKKPIKASEWINSCWSKDFPIQFDTTHADIYEPPEQSPEGDTQQFSRERFDQYLSEARGTNKDYSRVLAKIKKDYYAHHPDEKPEDKKRA